MTQVMDKLYQCDKWQTLDCEAVESFCCKWRTALRRLHGLPFNSHSVYFPLLTSTLPVLDEIYRRSARFILCCLHSSPNSLVQSLVWHGVVHAKYNSFIGKNALYCCNHFCWSVDDFILNSIDRSNVFFEQYFLRNLTEESICTSFLLFELVCLRDKFSTFIPDNNFLNKKEIEFLIKFVSSS